MKTMCSRCFRSFQMHSLTASRAEPERETGRGTPIGWVGTLRFLGRSLVTRHLLQDFPGSTVDKNLPANAEDTGSIPGPGRSHMPLSN